MLGCRALSPKEVQLISSELSLRNRCIFILGIRTGFRIRELLSLNIGDIVDENGVIRGAVKVQRCNVKGKGSSQTVPLHEEAKQAIIEYLKEFPGNAGEPLFRSDGNKSRGKRLHHSVFREQLSEACSRASIRDRHLVSTHSLRKTFAANMYGALEGDLFKLQRAMRHRSIQSTASYVAVDDEEIANAIKKAK